MRIGHLKIALFALFLAAPVATLLLLGGVESFGREQPDFPKPAEMLRGKGRAQLGDAVLERSAVMKLAVKLQNWVGYRLVGFVEERTVVSGKGGWLFYRPEFQEGACIEFDKVAGYFRQLGVLIDMSRASGLDLRISLSPNKSTIYRDQLHPLVRGYWRCQDRNVAGLRRLFKSEVPELIDHAEPLLAEKSRRPDIPLYFTGDTHWTPYGGAIAVRQLLAAVYPGLEIPPPQFSGTTKTKKMDLAAALLLPATESAGEVAPLPEEVLTQVNRRSVNVRTLISHDSFYAQIESQVRNAFPDAILVRGSPNSTGFASEIARADRLIVNMVERGLVKAIREGMLSWEATIASAIMTRNVALAADCGSFEAVARNAASADQDGQGAGEALDIPAMAEDFWPCVRLSLTASESATIEIAMPSAKTGAFEPGRAFTYRIGPGHQTIGFVLPDYAARSRIRVRTNEAVTLATIEIGTIERPRLASALQP